MSPRDDFYTPRRGAMADTGAYSGFLIGFLGAAPFGWSALMASFEDQGDATMGVMRFAGTLVAGGLFLGGAGYAIGAVSGRIWERRHRAANPREKPEAGPDFATLTAAAPEDTMAAVARAWKRNAQAGAGSTGMAVASAPRSERPDPVFEGRVVEGEVTLTLADGTERRYVAGDAFALDRFPRAIRTAVGVQTRIESVLPEDRLSGP